MSKRALRIFYGAMALLMLIPMAMGVLGLPRDRSAAQPPSVEAAEATLSSHLPIIQTDPSPTATQIPTPLPVATPTAAPYSAAGVMQITPFKAINASTFNTGSFVVTNTSLSDEKLTQIRIDLSTAIFPKMVFDPYGEAGDTVKKDVEIDDHKNVGKPSHTFEAPHDGGFDVLVMDFTDFDSNEFVAFSVDVDPTSIKGVGAPGPAESGSVSGLELVGSTITMTFDDGEVLTGQIWRMSDAGNDAGAYVDLRGQQLQAPLLQVLGQSAPAVVTEPNQTLRISGPAGQPVMVTVVEGGLFTDGVPNGGHNLEPFDANSAVVFREYSAQLGSNGRVDVPITLSRNGVVAGINIITAVFDNYHGLNGRVAAPIVLELQTP